MSNIRTALALADGVKQVVTDDTAPASALTNQQTYVPLTADGTAVRVTTTGGGSSSTTTSRTAAVLTGSYVTSTAVDLAGANGASVRYTVATATPSDVASVKPQWSNDGTNYWDEPVSVALGTSGTDVLGTLSVTYNYASRVLQIAMDTNRSLGERFNREARYIRFAAKGGGSTTATLAIFVTPINN